jgi:predicted O-methyltransferase YrrM
MLERQWRQVRKVGRIAGSVVRDGVLPLRLAREAIGRWGAIQRTWELAAMLGAVRRLRPRVVMEIGTHRGGTLMCLAAVARPDAFLLSLDMHTSPMGPEVAWEQVEARIRGTLKPGQELVSLRMDSHLASTREAVDAALAGRAVDFLFIDGDHTYEGVWKDFETYAPLVRPGGLIAFHDIHFNPDDPVSRVDRFWSEVRGRYRSRELIDQDFPGGTGMGIGILQVPRA